MSQDIGDKDLSFRTPDELARMLEALSRSLHAKNRISGGESGFSWHIAVLLQKIAVLVAMIEDADMWAEGGDLSGFEDLSRDAQAAFLLDFLAGKRGLKSELVNYSAPKQ
ncbi:hypothetical protein SLH49_14415 [Cognatiyoonia sp. IB215446]|uniref:hypothetical protein n=1 Tax=Cognatiyoonia sp. IB215446 TaxID=3097355 RepID=UPI002A1127F0|nr:hypothetical protein [Cognatiyoonia sp. IB215446]MDX8349176.1 hypothetical protein [Cognatiyoonia sp. IB215446]